MFETNRGGATALNENRNIFRASDLPNLTQATPTGKCILCTGYAYEYIKFAYLTDSTLSCFELNQLRLLRIIGLKFSGGGGGGGSSVTVDTEITATSQNPVTSQAIYTYVQQQINSIENVNGVSF